MNYEKKVVFRVVFKLVPRHAESIGKDFLILNTLTRKSTLKPSQPEDITDLEVL